MTHIPGDPKKTLHITQMKFIPSKAGLELTTYPIWTCSSDSMLIRRSIGYLGEEMDVA